MIVYRDQPARADPRAILAELRAPTGYSIDSHEEGHTCAVERLIQIGTLETAVCDAFYPSFDGNDPLLQTLRRASIAAGHELWHTWNYGREAARVWRQRSYDELDRLDQARLPEAVELNVPEGYAYYGVYPELYLEAAKHCHASLGPRHAVCLGLRSIGSSLSAAVAGALEELGWQIASWTLRPRGHPFSRVPQLSPELQALLVEKRHAHFLIIDEGPGISGSSLGGTAAMLRSLGITDDQIILFPSWEPDGSTLQSPTARDHWSRHRRFSRSFEEVWLQSGRLSSTFPGRLRDFSAGKWREALYSAPQDYPAAQPQHERRKYLLEPADSQPGERKLMSFVGLGPQAGRKVSRGHRIAEAGFTPKPEICVHGFMLRPFVPGVPVAVAQGEETALLERVANYLAYLTCEQSTEPTLSDATLREMTLVNLREGMPDLPLRADRLPEAWAERPVALDGRLFPHEWIRTTSGYLKVDAIDHHEDHFFPGCQDIAWDLAAASLEFRLTREARRFLVDRYRSLTHDRTIAHRLTHYSIAYLAFRLGYATLAAQVLGPSDDGLRFAAETQRYRDLLAAQLADGSHEYWNV